MSAPDRPWQDADDWLDGLPLCWQQKWLEAPTAQMFPLEVSSALLQVLSEEREKADGAVCLSWLELTVMLHVLGFSHPFEISFRGSTVWSLPSTILPAQHGQVTMAARIRFVRTFFKRLDEVFDCCVVFVRGLNLGRFRIHPPQNGLIVYASAGTLRSINTILLNWTSTRPVRTSNDLCRPL